MFSNIPETYTKCQNDKGTLIHCQKFWTEIIKCLSEVFNVKIPLCSKLCVLGIYPESFTQTNKQTKLLDFGHLHARRAIALCWKSMDAPFCM